jgi:hypothetical protein
LTAVLGTKCEHYHSPLAHLYFYDCSFVRELFPAQKPA